MWPILFGGIKEVIIGSYKAILKTKRLTWVMGLFPKPSCEFLQKKDQAHTSGMTLVWPKMTYTRFGSKALRAPSSRDLNPLEKNFKCSFKSLTCKSYHSKITSIKIYIAKTQRTPILGFQIKM